MFRIMNSSVKSGKKAPAVFLQHGLFGCADAWIDHTSELAPAF
jgi:hypothetical protein